MLLVLDSLIAFIQLNNVVSSLEEVNVSSSQFRSFAKQLVLCLLIMAKLFQIAFVVDASLQVPASVN